MSQRTWQGSGSRYTVSWGGQPWTLELDTDRPGLRAADRPEACVLALGGVASIGRFDLDALTGRSLVGVELVRDSVEATYLIKDWGGLQVRASWSPTLGIDGINLQLQVSASSVGELKGLETYVVSQLDDDGAGSQATWVQPRDRRSACFSYDGREPAADLRRLTTLSLLDSSMIGLSEAAVLGPARCSGLRYLEMVHPHDVARRIFRGQRQPDPAGAGQSVIRYGLFGHDLEKGVVVRARLRGLWFSGADTVELPAAALRDFMASPLPLGP